MWLIIFRVNILLVLFLLKSHLGKIKKIDFPEIFISFFKTKFKNFSTIQFISKLMTIFPLLNLLSRDYLPLWYDGIRMDGISRRFGVLPAVAIYQLLPKIIWLILDTEENPKKSSVSTKVQGLCFEPTWKHNTLYIISKIKVSKNMFVEQNMLFFFISPNRSLQFRLTFFQLKFVLQFLFNFF